MCLGLAGAVRLLQCGEGDVAEVFQEDELTLLYEAGPSDEARCGGSAGVVWGKGLTGGGAEDQWERAG